MLSKNWLNEWVFVLLGTSGTLGATIRNEGFTFEVLPIRKPKISPSLVSCVGICAHRGEKRMLDSQAGVTGELPNVDSGK